MTAEFGPEHDSDAEVIQLHANVPELPTVVPVAPGTRRPIVPEPLQRHNMRGTVTYAAGTGWHRARYHGLRAPFVYLPTYLWHATRGVFVLGDRLVRWWHAPHLHDLVSLAVASGRSGHHDAMNAHREGRKTRTRRGQILAVSLGLALAAGLVLAAFAPWWGWALLAVVALWTHPAQLRGFDRPARSRPPGRQSLCPSLPGTPCRLPAPSRAEQRRVWPGWFERCLTPGARSFHCHG